MIDVAVLGGGPAGMMAAYAAACQGRKVVLVEKNEKLGKKLFITGKGRCNLSNDCDRQDFFEQVVRNPKFLMSSFNRLSNHALVDLFEKYGLHTKVERGGRIFPVSDKSSDVIKALTKMLNGEGVEVLLNTKVHTVTKDKTGFILDAGKRKIDCQKLILATGGLSYPQTGSTGDGYKWAEAFGHRIVQTHPALVPLEDSYNFCAQMQGLTLKNVAFTLFQNNTPIYAEQGELLFTHFGLSGPVVLSASSYIDFNKKMTGLYAVIDLKPALHTEKLDARLLRDIKENSNKQLKTYIPALLPSKMVQPFLEQAQLNGQKPLNSMTKEERKRLNENLKNFRIEIAGPRPIEEGIITAGGVDIKQVDPKTMESRVVSGLYFAGELLDVSALTGGFNLQIAFSTGFCAGTSI